MTTGATLSSDGRLRQRLRAVTEPAAAFQNYIISKKQSSGSCPEDPFFLLRVESLKVDPRDKSPRMTAVGELVGC